MWTKHIVAVVVSKARQRIERRRDALFDYEIAKRRRTFRFRVDLEDCSMRQRVHCAAKDRLHWRKVEFRARFAVEMLSKQFAKHIQIVLRNSKLENYNRHNFHYLRIKISKKKLLTCRTRNECHSKINKRIWSACLSASFKKLGWLRRWRTTVWRFAWDDISH